MRRFVHKSQVEITIIMIRKPQQKPHSISGSRVRSVQADGALLWFYGQTRDPLNYGARGVFGLPILMSTQQLARSISALRYYHTIQIQLLLRNLHTTEFKKKKRTTPDNI